MRTHRGAPHERVAVLQSRADDVADPQNRRRSQTGERARARDGRLLAIADDGLQQIGRAGNASRSRAERLGVALEPPRLVAIPGLHLLGRPLGGAVGVATCTGVGHSQLHREIGPGDTKAVVVARIDHHVGRGRHVTAETVGAARAARVEVMRRRRVLLGGVAVQAHLAPRCPELEAVRVVAIRAGHAPAEHLRLQK